MNKKLIHLGPQYYSLLRSLKGSSYSQSTVLMIQDLAKSIYAVDDDERKKYFIKDLRDLTVGEGFVHQAPLYNMVHCFIPFERGALKMEVEIRCIRWEGTEKEHLGWSIHIQNGPKTGENQYSEMYTSIIYTNHRTKTIKECKIPWREGGLIHVK